MSKYPEKLQSLLEDFELVDDRDLHSDMLIEIAERFEEVPEEVAKRPYSEDHLVPGCESEAYVWATPLDDGAVKYYFAVENPHGISAKAMSVILDESLSGLPLSEAAKVDEEIVSTIFGGTISMGKGQGLMNMIRLLKYLGTKSKS